MRPSVYISGNTDLFFPDIQNRFLRFDDLKTSRLSMPLVVTICKHRNIYFYILRPFRLFEHNRTVSCV
jgi:hypothetical protein